MMMICIKDLSVIPEEGESRSPIQATEQRRACICIADSSHITNIILPASLFPMTKKCDLTYRLNEMRPSRVMNGRAEILHSSHFSSILLKLHDNILSQIMIIMFTTIPNIPKYKGILERIALCLDRFSAKDPSSQAILKMAEKLHKIMTRESAFFQTI